MKKIIKLFVFLLITNSTTAQESLKPTLITRPDIILLQQIENLCTRIRQCDETPQGCYDPVPNPGRPIDSLFFSIIKNAKGASKWGIREYRAFIIKVDPLLKSAGIKADSNDGGEIFVDQKNSKEVFASQRVVTKYILFLTQKYKININ